MRGFGGLTEAIDSLLASVGVSLPPWAFPALLVAGFVALFPHIRQNQRTNKARIKIRECSESGGGNDPHFQQELFDLAHGHTVTLNVIATEAHKYGLLDIAKRALRELQASGGRASDIHRLHRLLHGPPPVHTRQSALRLQTPAEHGPDRADARHPPTCTPPPGR